MRQATLFVLGAQRVVRRPEVGYQRAAERLDEELLQGRAAPATINHVVAHLGIGEAPQPPGLPVDAGARLVGVQNGTVPGLVGDLLVPGLEDPRRPQPDGHQATG